MRYRDVMCLLGLVALVASLVGCGATATSNRGSSSYSSSYSSRQADDRPSIAGDRRTASSVRPTAKASAEQVDYYGLTAYKLTNGIVTLIAVPDIGGRIMEYNLGDQPLLWANREELRQAADTSQQPQSDKRTWRNYGGYKVWPAPQTAWGGPPDPEGSELDGGRWEGKLTNRSGPSVSVEMISPLDKQGTGLQITRRITLFANTSQVSVNETFTNVTTRDISWSIWGVTQVPGSAEPGVKASPEAQVFFPLNANSRHPKGYVSLIAGGGTGQWKPIANGAVLRTSYAGETGKVGADSDGGWVAYVNDLQKYTFAQSFKVTQGADYPDEGSTVQVYTSPSDLSYMEMEFLSPITKIAPGKRFSFETTWRCTKLGGPIVKVTDAGAVTKHPVLARQGKSMLVTGECGVFTPGQLSVEFLGKGGKRLSSTKPINVSPATTVTLSIRADVPEEAVGAYLVLSSDKGQRIGNLAEVPLSAGLAKAPASATKQG